MKTLALIVAAILALVLAGCRDGGEDHAPMVQVRESDMGGQINVKQGQTLEVILPANPSTGYQWHCSWQPRDLLQLVSREYSGSGTHRPGAGGVSHFLIKAVGAGTATLTVQYGRWWKGGQRQPAQTLRIIIGAPQRRHDAAGRPRPR